jgi:hypothetical protein
MDKKKPEVRRHGRAYEFRHCFRKPSPEWLARRGKVTHLDDQEAAQTRRWWLFAGGLALAALALGVVIGRFLLS